MKRLFISTIFAVVAFTSNAQIITIYLSTTKTICVSESVTKKLIDTNSIVINTSENTASFKGSGVWYEETVEISSYDENYGKITFHDEVNDVEYVIDLYRNTVRRVDKDSNITTIIEYQISELVEQ